MKYLRFPLSVIIGLLLGLSLAAYSVLAWSPPASSPPSGNTAAPVNVGSTSQTKAGNFTSGGSITGTAGLSAPSGGLYVGGSAQIDNYVGIGTPVNSAYRLWVNGPLRLTDGTQALGRVLTSDASGVASWQTLPAGIGGSGTTNYIPKFLSSTSLGNSQIFDNGTNVGIGTTSPAAKLTIQDTRDKNYPGLFLAQWQDPNSGWAFTPTAWDAGGDPEGLDILRRASGSDQFVMTITTGGNVGINKTNPAQKLSVTGQSHVSRDNTAECCSSGDFTTSLAESTNTTGKKSSLQFHNSGIAEGFLRLDVGSFGRELRADSYQTDMDLHATGVVQGDQGLCIGADCRTSWPATGTGTVTSISQASGIVLTPNPITSMGTVAVDQSATSPILNTSSTSQTKSGALTANGGFSTNGGLFVLGGSQLQGNVGIGQAVGTEKLEVTGNIKTTGSIVVGGGTGKITVGTVDPVFDIFGKKYATYMAGMQGVKEEITGVMPLTYNEKEKAYAAVIDFNALEEGSGLWVFWHVIDRDMSAMSVLLTPNAAARVWYKKDADGQKLMLMSDSVSEVSYRFTAPRFDSATWGNRVEDASIEGLKVPWQ